MYMKTNHVPLTQAHFNSICYPASWQIEESAYPTLHQIPKIIRPEQLLGGFISGSLVQPKLLNGYLSVAGFDILIYEPNPYTTQGETNLNAYHYIIQRTGHPTFPYILRGAFRDETLVGHWPQDLILTPYGF